MITGLLWLLFGFFVLRTLHCFATTDGTSATPHVVGAIGSGLLLMAWVVI